MGMISRSLNQFNNRSPIFEEEVPLELIELYQQSFLETRNFYNKSISDLQILNKNKMEAFLCPALSRSPYEGSVFRRLLKNQFNYNLKITHKKPLSISNSYKDCVPLALAIGIMVKNSLSSLYHLLKQKRFAAQFKTEHQPYYEIVIDEYLVPASVESGIYKDRYFPELIQLLENKTKEKCAILLSFGTIRDYRELSLQFKNCPMPCQILFKENFLSPKDYVWAFFKSFRFFTLEIPFKEFNGFQFSDSIKRELLMEAFSHNTMTAHLSYRFAKKISNKEIKINTFVNWFENQLIDKGLNKGLSIFSPDTIRIGFQNWIVSPYISFHNAPSQPEIDNNYTPRKIALNGPALQKRFSEFLHNLEPITFIPAPSFRFLDIFKSDNQAQSDFDSNSLLILMPIQFEQTKQIAEMLNLLLKKYHFIKCTIKFHPAFLGHWIQRIESILESHPSIIFSDSPLYKLCHKNFIVISSSSSAALEAMALGKICIVYTPVLGIYESTIPTDLEGPFGKRASTPIELFEVIENIFSQKKHGHDDSSAHDLILQNYFTKLSPSGLFSILPKTKWAPNALSDLLS